MHKVFLLGEGTSEYADALADKGYGVRKFRAPRPALDSVAEASLLVLDRDQRGKFAAVVRASKGIPKLALSSSSSSRKMAPWLREPLTYALHEPDERELLDFSARIIKEAEIIQEYGLIRREMRKLGDELGFLEEMNRILTSSGDVTKVITTIMKRVKDAIRANAWSIMIMDEVSGEPIFEKSAGMARKTKSRKMSLAPLNGVSEWVINKGRPLLLEDVTSDATFSSKVKVSGNYKPGSVMCVPIRIKERTLGVVEVINRAGAATFTREDLDLLIKLMDQTALAVERLSLQQKLEELAITDDLTKLFNSRYLNRSIEGEIQRSERYSSSVSLIFMDVDFFKNINDNYGHLIGSKVLVEMGQLLINELRSIDIVARYGGDEFVIVLPQTTLNNALLIAERIRKSVERNLFLKTEGLNLKLTASFGVAAYPESAQSKEDLMRIADESMYKVKYRTRNGVYAII